MGSPTVSTHALHAALIPAPALVDERRTLYRLAAEMFAPGTELSDNLADHPIVRYEIGRALALPRRCGPRTADPGRVDESA